MVSWKRFEGDDRAWDAALEPFPDANPFQGAAWARHKADSGWAVVRLVADGAAVQFLMKKVPGARVLWSRGGPLGDPALWDEGLRRAAAAACTCALSYIRIGPYRAGDGEQVSRLGWSRPLKPLAGEGSFELDLSKSEAELLQDLSGNWAHNLRRGLKRAAFRVWENPQADQLAALYRDLEAYKGLKPQHQEAELASMLKHLGERVVVMRADGETGEPVAMRACVIWGGRAWDLLAAATAEGRKSYASYALLWELLLSCRRRGVRRYDLGGADAVKAKGVYDFKKGTGARPIEYLGEWDWARWSWLRRAANLALAYKGIGDG